MQTERRVILFFRRGSCFSLLVLLLQISGPACLQTLEPPDERASGYIDDPFVEPRILTPLNLPGAWPTSFRRDPQDLSPANTSTKLVTLGTGMPSPNPYRADLYAADSSTLTLLEFVARQAWKCLIVTDSRVLGGAADPTRAASFARVPRESVGEPGWLEGLGAPRLR